MFRFTQNSHGKICNHSSIHYKWKSYITASDVILTSYLHMCGQWVLLYTTAVMIQSRVSTLSRINWRHTFHEILTTKRTECSALENFLTMRYINLLFFTYTLLTISVCLQQSTTMYSVHNTYHQQKLADFIATLSEQMHEKSEAQFNIRTDISHSCPSV